MLPFTLRFEPGLPAYEQVVFAVKKAAASGRLKAGDRFPSVRLLSQELRIHPNTAHKVVAALVGEGLLEVRPGVGTVVSNAPPASREQRRALLRTEVERLVVEAMTLSVNQEDLKQALKEAWERLERR